MYTQEDRIEMLLDAQEQLGEVISLIKDAVRGTDSEHYAGSYVIPTLLMAKNEEHGYLGSQPANLDELIAAFEDGDEDED